METSTEVRILELGAPPVRVRQLRVEMRCDACGEGFMRPVEPGFVSLATPPCYPHQCSHCGNSQTFVHAYPRSSFEAADVEPEYEYSFIQYIETSLDEE